MILYTFYPEVVSSHCIIDTGVPGDTPSLPVGPIRPQDLCTGTAPV